MVTPDTAACVVADCDDIWCLEHSLLMKAAIRFWTCSVVAHSERNGVVTVEWRGAVAHCTYPGCGRHS